MNLLGRYNIKSVLIEGGRGLRHDDSRNPLIFSHKCLSWRAKPATCFIALSINYELKITELLLRITYIVKLIKYLST
jgi:hypothetical protein